LTLAGSPIENQTMRLVYSAASGIAPQSIPAWVMMPAAPSLRGKE